MDGAYGGFFLLTERGRRAMAGAERSDSIVLDPHKSLFLPYGIGSLLVRDGDALKRAHALSAAYLPSMQEDPDLVDFNQISPELSRSWRGLRVWLPIKMHGIGALPRQPRREARPGRVGHGGAAEDPGHRDPGRAQLSIVAFRWKDGDDDGSPNRINRDLLERINAKKRVYLTGTLLDGRFAIRICVLSFRTHAERMREGMEDIRTAIAAIWDRPSP